jgi:PAS domain S-box-containing protein
MKDPSGSDRELIKEISVLKKRVRDLERSKTGGNETGEAAGVNNLYPLSVLDAHPYPIYVCDPESYELLYCNRVLVESRGEPGRKKCYEYLQSRTAPCPFCTNDKILGENLGKNFVWDFQNETSLRWYRCLDRAITWADGRIVRYELAVDITDRREAEEALRKSEEKYKYLTESMNDIVWTTDLEMNTTYVSPSIEKVLGFTIEERMQQSLVDQLTPETLATTAEILFGELENDPEGDPDRSISLDLYYYHKDGSARCLETRLSFVRDEKGVPSGIYGLSRDVTERKRAQEALSRAEEKYRQLFDLESDAIFLIDNETGRILEANNAASLLYGYTREELLERKNRDLSAEPEQTRAATRKELSTVPLRYHRKKDGTVFAVDIRATHLTWNGRRSHLAAIRDITERKRAEEELLGEREKLQTLSNNAPFGMILLDSEGRFTYVNIKFTEIFGYSLSDIPDGRTWLRKAYPNNEYRHGVISAWKEDFREARPGEQKSKVFNVECADGTRKTVKFTTSVVGSGDYLMTCEDITEMTQLESHLRHAQKMESIGTLAGGIAHDFNNILTSLMGYASLMQMNMDKGNPVRRYADQIVSASRKAADLTRSLLTFSRQQPVTLTPLDMNNTIRAMKELLERLLTENIELRTSLTRDDTVVLADKSQMDQIFFNLATNARDAMPAGGTVTIETSVAAIDSAFIDANGFGKRGMYVLISVSDTGEGMDEATQEKIFDPFFTTKGIGKGTGLGLATVYGIMKQHGGYITVDSELNLGTTFRIYFPAASADVDEAHDAATPIATGNEKILIAEDDDGVRRLMREALQECGYTIIEAVDGQDAIDKFTGHPDIDLIVVDSVMPRKNGREVYAEIHGMDPDVRVLFTSGYTRDIVLDKGIEDGQFDFIAKPLLFASFLEKVREILDRQ